jgi:hypothetical protein
MQYVKEQYYECTVCNSRTDRVEAWHSFEKGKDYVAWLLRKLADHLLKESAECNEEGEVSLANMYVEDAKDMNDIAGMVDAGFPLEAFKKLRSLDTAARDKAPEAAWQWLTLQEEAWR